MKSVLIHGEHQPFVTEDVTEPEGRPGEVKIKVHASCWNHRDIWIQKGLYSGIKFPLIPGSDGAGVIVNSNPEGRDRVLIDPSFHWGESEKFQSKAFRILGLPDPGTFAEYVCVPEENVYPVPDHLSFEQAAALPLAGITAYRALFVRAGLSHGENVLITGIGGGVATMGLVFALSVHANVWVTSGADEKIERAIAMGAKGGVNYKTQGWADAIKKMSGGIDVSLDGAGGTGFASLVEVAAPGGRIAIYGGTSGPVQGLSPQRLFWKQLSVFGSTMGSPSDFSAMLRLVSEKKIIPVVDEIFPIDSANDAAERMKSSRQFGRIVMKNA